jgi:tetratricopeptide (TPR) repeat protein
MNRLVLGAGIAITLGLGSGQLTAQAEEYQGPTCDLDQSHFLVRQASTYIKGATEEADPAAREQLLASARQNLLEGIQTDQADNPAIWYFLGRYYDLANDPMGADSAFSRVEQAVPDCAQDIDYYRESMWVKAVNRGIDSIQNGMYEGAKHELRGANAIYQRSNVSYFYLASVFADEGDADSALYYFKKVVEMGPGDVEHIDNYNISVENVATLYQMLGDWDSTVVWFQKVRENDPTNSDAMFGMAEAYSELGNEAEAIKIYDEVLANAANMSALDLFSAGGKLFNASEFDKAAQAFEAGLEKNPYYRDALFNLANTYLEIAQDESRPQAERDEALRKMDDVTHRLVEVDPHSRVVYRILAAAHTLQGMDDSTEIIMQTMEALTFEVAVDLSRSTDGGYMVAGRIINLKKDAETAVPTITFEFLDASGNVIDSETTGGQTLAAGASTQFHLTAPGEGIVAWRYKTGT